VLTSLQWLQWLNVAAGAAGAVGAEFHLANCISCSLAHTRSFRLETWATALQGEKSACAVSKNTRARGRKHTHTRHEPLLVKRTARSNISSFFACGGRPEARRPKSRRSSSTTVAGAPIQARRYAPVPLFDLKSLRSRLGARVGGARGLLLLRAGWGALPDLVLVLVPVVFCCLPVTRIWPLLFALARQCKLEVTVPASGGSLFHYSDDRLIAVR
jgi:hypothetical protein